VKDAEIREFVNRSRGEVMSAKREHWASLHRARGPAATVAASQALRQHMRRLRPEWPTDRDRAADLAHHLELKRKIDAAAHAFAR
jgi:hypothetical protein